MARENSTPTKSTRRLYLSVIIGLILGVAIAGATDHWWWSTVGVLAGGAVGGISELVRRRSDKRR